MMIKLPTLALICATLATPLAAQDAAPSSFDWTGPYLGVNQASSTTTITTALFEVDLDFDGSGAQLGYLVDRGALVFGGEIAASRLDMFGAVRGDGATHSSARAMLGYSVHRALLYASAGIGRVEFFDDAGPINMDSGPIFGIGARYAVTDRVSIGLEYTRQSIQDFAGQPFSMASGMYRYSLSYKF